MKGFFYIIFRKLLCPMTTSLESEWIKISSHVAQVLKFVIMRVESRKPTVLPTAYHFARESYLCNSKKPISLVYYVVASAHLASKACEEPRSSGRYIDAIDLMRLTPGIASEMSSLGGIGKIGLDFRKLVTANLMAAEKQVVFDVRFNFTVHLPHEHVFYVISRVISWHAPQRTEDFCRLVTFYAKKTYKVLNEYEIFELFYKFPHPLIALVIVGFTFKKKGTPVVTLGKIEWQKVIYPQFTIEDYVQVYDEIEQILGLKYPEIALPKQSDHFMSKWYSIPLEYPAKCEHPVCPPPPLELLREIAGPPDAFFSYWDDPVPDIPPPPNFGERVADIL